MSFSTCQGVITCSFFSAFRICFQTFICLSGRRFCRILPTSPASFDRGTWQTLSEGFAVSTLESVAQQAVVRLVPLTKLGCVHCVKLKFFLAQKRQVFHAGKGCRSSRIRTEANGTAQPGTIGTRPGITNLVNVRLHYLWSHLCCVPRFIAKIHPIKTMYHAAMLPEVCIFLGCV